ncbi:hypothetical protein [Aureimonas psammosilenae]|uniref:hypothetical protein n=1 Tax=Aureimonas psammosilenae TaxID=2495496 RepID=UPI00126079F4|nr:hypothetical protein [Aureimonas psammosilenae]
MDSGIGQNVSGGNVVAFPSRFSPRHPLDAEAARRLRRSGYEEWAAREKATGVPMPASMRYLKMQIEFAAERLKLLDPLPEDFRADIFWPA